ncbi:MAG: hypothetical protein IPL26_03580 [Leptospiraceae bacterium]|nr:hypothetical protein [Leptospiraceae bacterium]
MFLFLATAILLYLEPNPCDKITAPQKGEIWKFDFVWHYSPLKLRNNSICGNDIQEYFYIRQKDRASYIAMKKVKITKESSCRNNALFNGKQKLFRGMLQSVKEDNTNLSSIREKEILTEIALLNDKIEHAGTYDCSPLNTKNVTDPDVMWEECECILYGFYPQGKLGLLERVDKKINSIQ